MNAVLRAGTELADLLAAENAALQALALTEAATFAERKAAALSAFAAALQTETPERWSAAERAFAQTLNQRLAALAEQNKRLLERAIKVQNRILDMLAHVVPRALGGQAACYGARGHLASAPMPPVALSARA
jgi:flagellar biosynthesis/type III secretory pathway chaperone